MTDDTAQPRNVTRPSFMQTLFHMICYAYTYTVSKYTHKHRYVTVLCGSTHAVYHSVSDNNAHTVLMVILAESFTHPSGCTSIGTDAFVKFYMQWSNAVSKVTMIHLPGLSFGMNLWSQTTIAIFDLVSRLQRYNYVHMHMYQVWHRYVWESCGQVVESVHSPPTSEYVPCNWSTSPTLHLHIFHSITPWTSHVQVMRYRCTCTWRTCAFTLGHVCKACLIN